LEGAGNESKPRLLPVALVNMPFSSARFPSTHIGSLQRILCSVGITSTAGQDGCWYMVELRRENEMHVEFGSIMNGRVNLDGLTARINRQCSAPR
jgi:hypothetical protein